MIGVFLALDLFLFYIFWEIVLVPMYLIIGIWGGANRIYATIKFVLYTLVGSLLMLVAILATAFAYQAATGLVDGRVRLHRAARVRDRGRVRAGASRSAPSSPSSWPSRSRSRCSRSTPGCQTPTPRRPTAGSVILAGDPAQARGVRVHPVRRAALPRRRAHVRADDHRPVAHRDHLRRDRRARPARPETPRRVLVGEPHGLRDARHLRVHRAGHPGRDPADDQPRPDHRRPVPARRRDLRADPRPDDRQDGRPRRRDPV